MYLDWVAKEEKVGKLNAKQGVTENGSQEGKGGLRRREGGKKLQETKISGNQSKFEKQTFWIAIFCAFGQRDAVNRKCSDAFLWFWVANHAVGYLPHLTNITGVCSFGWWIRIGKYIK